jgi:hypothetical protein
VNHTQGSRDSHSIGCLLGMQVLEVDNRILQPHNLQVEARIQEAHKVETCNLEVLYLDPSCSCLSLNLCLISANKVGRPYVPLCCGMVFGFGSRVSDTRVRYLTMSAGKRVCRIDVLGDCLGKETRKRVRGYNHLCFPPLTIAHDEILPLNDATHFMLPVTVRDQK